jgi:hypothetical protein
MNANRIVNAITGEELPVMFGKGGMKKFFESQTLTASVSNNNITLDEACGSIGNGNLVCVTTIMDNGSVLQEIVDAEVNEKRKRADVEQGRRVRFCRDGVPRPYPPAPSQPVPIPRSAYIPKNVSMQDNEEEFNGICSRETTSPVTPAKTQPRVEKQGKYQITLELTVKQHSC